MDPYIIVKRERRTFPKDTCPVDLMGEIDKEEKGPKVFILNTATFLGMIFYPVKKRIEVDGNIISVYWKPSMEDMDLQKIKEDGKDLFKVLFSDTAELQYTCPVTGEVTAYYIEEEQ